MCIDRCLVFKMADLPPSIGFEDEPVILLRYTTLDDSLPDSKSKCVNVCIRKRRKSKLNVIIRGDIILYVHTCKRERRERDMRENL